MIPLKNAIDQQEMCERAIIQQNKKELEQKLESAREQELMFEMQLDSASNYMESKQLDFESTVTQYKEKISVLEEEKHEMQQELARQAERIKALEAMLENAESSGQNGIIVIVHACMHGDSC